ncbi:acyl-CoA dehydrogenase-like protein [Actinomadura hallensis]|uniref:Acyl-CoA dehydrogenase-like protein n=1 Tax=Actinomadura hallensis TaxID=337895 RepID=A0A543IK01_9ACTN|nr:acyl-CoA dehydrogenase family protein [Actinomadura hallensis]TQM70916.1 acyl-CoA dehydrogenase-like protein [Actinomadura hallensis]HLV71707.1 acyl-CoA dehydrogenase family protein [Vulgatibacteraceae bacterium]
MKFVLSAEQRMFGETLRKLLAEGGAAKAARAWASGDTAPGRALWSAAAEAGVFAVAVPEADGGAGVLPVELAVAAEELGRAAAPGPYVETLAAAELLGGTPWPARIAEGDAVVSMAVPHALDADVADLVIAADGAERAAGEPLASLDPARRLFRVEGGGGFTDLGALLCAAQQIGLGRALLDVSVEYAKTRHQFGRPIGEYQAVKHHLASAMVELEFARPLVYGAALSYGTPDFARDVSAAKAAASEASYGMAKTALQVHGAIGYTDEYDPSLWIRKARALYSAWGTPSEHRARVMSAL